MSDALEWREDGSHRHAKLADGSRYLVCGEYGGDGHRACYLPPIVTKNLVHLGIAQSIEKAMALCEAHHKQEE
jgi:hypothetical protein